MADKENSNDNKKKKSIIASLDLKNYKAKYTDSYGLGKPNEVNLDNFLIAEPDPEADDKKNLEKSVDDKITKVENKVNDEPITADTKKVIDPNNSTVKNTIEPTEPSKVSIRDDDFERRVNAEADNDFYDDKPAQQINETFRSGAIKSKSTAENNFNPVGDDASKEIKPNRKLNLREPIKVNVRHELKERTEDFEVNISEKKPVRRTETYGVVISAVAFIYSIFTKDKPLLFLSVSLLLYLMRPIIAAPFGKYSQSVQNAIKGFSMALFFGSIFFIFF